MDDDPPAMTRAPFVLLAGALWGVLACGSGAAQRVADGGPATETGGPSKRDAGKADGGPSSSKEAGKDARVGSDTGARDARVETDGAHDAGVRDSASCDGPCVAAGPFVHPGVLLGKPQLDFVKTQVGASAAPWAAAFAKAKAHSLSSLSYTPTPSATLSRNDSSATTIANDDIAAYSDALLYWYTGDTAYADLSIKIVNAWATTLTAVDDTAQLDAAWASEVFPVPPRSSVMATRPPPGCRRSTWLPSPRCSPR